MIFRIKVVTPHRRVVRAGVCTLIRRHHQSTGKLPAHKYKKVPKELFLFFFYIFYGMVSSSKPQILLDAYNLVLFMLLLDSALTFTYLLALFYVSCKSYMLAPRIYSFYILIPRALFILSSV